ncbi:hypothetical protein C3941_08825 [Kaistia algarum]|uniref:DUF6456 domain-containing protein n=1 Tax=Kaistia algarum TaxID=2083279 RepID=UPI000CE85CBB|nr:DUF6456 domain-containing protein [Kaistia algarum]MCX5512161.1 DUF6456 domain-containing protein [Kaistia algarum]PPE80262.1 hypothetical protein C3941_08825 [Kaistia algarum]
MKKDPIESRLIRRLAAGNGYLLVEGDMIRLLVGANSEPVVVDPAVFRRVRASGALREISEGRWELSRPGLALARRLAAVDGDFRRQHQSRSHQRIGDGVKAQWVAVDLGESPLAWLRSRKGRDGEPMIADASFQAGERLRSDFTRGQMMPSVTSNWSLASPANHRSGSAGGKGELTDAALAARIRVERALTALGPELSGTVVDFCCFLKGIETIERERNWPKRSARLVLQLGLSALARHYGFVREAIGPQPRGSLTGTRRSDVA